MLVQLSSMPHPIAIHIHEGGDVNEKSKASEPKLVLRDVNFYYGRAQALFKVNITRSSDRPDAANPPCSAA